VRQSEAMKFARASVLLVAVAVGCQGQISGTDPGGGKGSGGTPGASGGANGSGSGGSHPGSGGAGQGSGGSSAGSGGSGGTTPAGSGGTGTPGSGGATVTIDCSKPRAAITRAQLLSASQYTHTVQDLFQVTGNPGEPLGNQVFAQLDQAGVEQRATVAASVAQQAAANLSKWAPCTPPATGDATSCEQQIIDKIGTRAFRRALTSAEKTDMKTLFDAGIKEKDFGTGVEWYLTGLLQAPDFMYEIVRPEAGEVAGEVRPLPPYDYASRLAYFVWDSPPDDKLLTAAGANELADAAKRQTHIDRMVQDPKFMRGVESFYNQWLHTEAFKTLARDADGFDASVVQALQTSLVMSATQLYTSGSPNITGLFSGQSYYMNDVLRRFYGLTGTGTTFTTVAMEGQSRRGIVTHPALMAALARPKESFPVGRGLFVMRTLLCKDIPLPNGLTIPEVPPAMPGVSTRQRYEMHSSNGVCAQCHKLFDPAGFALEGFDEVGRYRTTDNGAAVDSSGTMAAGTDMDGAFANGDELLARLAQSQDIRACFAKQYLKFALARDQLVDEDTCSADAVGKSFAPTGDLKQIVSNVASTDAFRQRLAEGVAP